MTFGAAFVPHPTLPSPPEDETLKALLRTVQEMNARLADLPAPQVNVAPTPVDVDLSDVVTAIQGVRGNATADEIAAALAPLLRRDDPPDATPMLTEVVEALKKLDFRLQGSGTQAYGGGASQMHHANSSGRMVKTGTGNPMPTQESKPEATAAVGSRATAGTDTCVAAPGAGFKLRVHHLGATTDPTSETFPIIKFKDGDGTVIEQGYAVGTSPRTYLLDLPENKALQVETTAAGTVVWSVHTETVAA